MSFDRYAYGTPSAAETCSKRAVLERLVGLADVGGRRGLHLLARLQHRDLAGLQIDGALVVLVAALRGIERLVRRRRRDEERVHRRDLLPVELGVVVLVEQEQLHDAGREARHAAQLPGVDRIDDVHDLGRRDAHDLAGNAGIGDVARMPAQEVVGDPPADRVELDALADDVAARAQSRSD